MSTVRETSPDFVVTHPNRDSAAARGTRLAVIVVLAASAILLAVITWASWGTQQGAVGLQIVLGLLFVYFAYAVVHWRAGVLPIAAGTAIVAGVFAAVSTPGWFNRGGIGYDQPALAESVIGVLVFAFAVLQLVSVVVCAKAFTQQWQVELEVPRSSVGRPAVA